MATVPPEPSKVVGALSNAATTEANYAIAIRRYNDFASNNDCPQYKDLTVEYLEGKDDEEGSKMICKLFSRFGSYLLLPISKTKGQPYFKPGSCAQYFSSFKTVLGKRFSGMNSLHPPNDEWYTFLYRLVKVSSAKETMARGESVTDSSASIWRAVLQGVCFALMVEGDCSSYLYRAAMLLVYHAIGRASEAMTMTWDSMEFNTSLEALQSEWLELKTGKSAPMSFFIDAFCYKVCAVHALFCYLVSDGGNSFVVKSGMVPDGASFVFPQFVHIGGAGGIARKITSILKKLAKEGNVPGLTENHTSQGLKHGAADDCSYNLSNNLIAVIARANWDYSGQVSKNRDMFEFDLKYDTNIYYPSLCCFIMSHKACT